MSTHSVIVVPIPAAYPLLLLPPSGSPAGRLLTTLRWRLFSCAAVFSHAAGKPTLKLAVATPQRRAWWHVLLRQLSADEHCDAVAALSARAGPHQLILPSIA